MTRVLLAGVEGACSKNEAIFTLRDTLDARAGAAVERTVPRIEDFMLQDLVVDDALEGKTQL